MDQVYLDPFDSSKGTYFSLLPNDMLREIIRHISNEKDYMNFILVIKSRIDENNYVLFKSKPIIDHFDFSKGTVILSPANATMLLSRTNINKILSVISTIYYLLPIKMVIADKYVDRKINRIHKIEFEGNYYDFVVQQTLLYK